MMGGKIVGADPNEVDVNRLLERVDEQEKQLEKRMLLSRVNYLGAELRQRERDHEIMLHADGVRNIELVQNDFNAVLYEEHVNGTVKQEHVINEHITMKLIGKRTHVFIDGKRFDQCMYLMLHVDTVDDLQEISSIDELSAYLDQRNEHVKDIIDPETEFIGHCSNIQAWVEHDYDTRILHSNLSFPLLSGLAAVGDETANRVLHDEIDKRVRSGFPQTIITMFDTVPNQLKTVVLAMTLSELQSLKSRLLEYEGTNEYATEAIDIIKWCINYGRKTTEDIEGP